MPEDFELRPAPLGEMKASDEAGDSSFRICAQPILAPTTAIELDTEGAELPRTYGAPALFLMVRDPHTLFAYWDIDWNTTFRDQRSKDRVVFLRVLKADNSEAALLEVEPMAASSYVTVDAADAVYTGEIGYFHPPTAWNCLASSGVVTTPSDSSSNEDAADFTTVPFHLSFQRMVDLLRVANEENASLTETLSKLRARADASDASMSLNEREVARAIDEVEFGRHVSHAGPPSPLDPAVWEKLERILGFGASSSSGGFGGNSS